MTRNLKYDDFKNGIKHFQGKLAARFYGIDGEIFKISTEMYFKRTDFHTLPITGFFPEVELFQIEGKLVLVFMDNHFYTYVNSIKVIESQTLNPFDGFEPGKQYELRNGQIWQQVGGPYAPNHHSSGYVQIISDTYIMVDNWSFYPEVRLIKN